MLRTHSTAKLHLGLIRLISVTNTQYSTAKYTKVLQLTVIKLIRVGLSTLIRVGLATLIRVGLSTQYSVKIFIFTFEKKIFYFVYSYMFLGFSPAFNFTVQYRLVMDQFTAKVVIVHFIQLMRGFSAY